MAKVAKGDMKACRDLCSAHMNRAYSVAYMMLGNASHSEDVVQDAFLRLWKIAPKWQAKAQISTWLHTVIHNLCIDRLRKENRFSDGEMPEIEDPAPDPLEQRQRDQVNDQVQQAIQQLPARQRVAVTLVHFEECSNIDAAAKMDISVDALESLLARGRRKLRELLTPQRGELGGVVK